MKKDTYNTILTPSKETLFKEKGSKFFGYAFPVSKEEDVKKCLDYLRKENHTARHMMENLATLLAYLFMVKFNLLKLPIF
jgi:putative IMPACT (imprinted ancient) family translation regulator